MHLEEQNLPISNAAGVQYYKCKHCSFGFENKRSQVHHNATVHQGKKLLECQKCDSKFTQKVSLILHLSTVHDEKNPYPW